MLLGIFLVRMASDIPKEANVRSKPVLYVPCMVPEKSQKMGPTVCFLPPFANYFLKSRRLFMAAASWLGTLPPLWFITVTFHLCFSLLCDMTLKKKKKALTSHHGRWLCTGNMFDCPFPLKARGHNAHDQNNLRCGFFRPQPIFLLCASPSQMSSGQRCLRHLLMMLLIQGFRFAWTSQLASVDAAKNCLLTVVFRSKSHILILEAIKSVLAAVLPGGS